MENTSNPLHSSIDPKQFGKLLKPKLFAQKNLSECQVHHIRLSLCAICGILDQNFVDQLGLDWHIGHRMSCLPWEIVEKHHQRL